MPKAPSSALTLPLSGLFAVVKPSGYTSMSVVNDIKYLVARSRLFVHADKLKEHKAKTNKVPLRDRGKRPREAVKIGQGGTLDPLADGVLVIGVGKGTKSLNDLLEGVKVATSIF
jgi:tRNA pseudouridine55 synthase